MLCFIKENVMTAVRLGFTAWALLTVSLGAVFAVMKLIDVFSRKENKE